MSEPRKNHLNIDGAQAKEEENADSYKPIPEADQEFRSSKSALAKSKEKVSSDPAEEKLLKKEDEVKITPMATEAKYDHRNGDTKIELDAAKRQFSGLTKEELLKYADDPFWVRLRWFMFVLFWALWLCMLAGAIAIIIRAPKCAAPPPKTWYEVGPLVDASSESTVDYTALEAQLAKLEKDSIKGVFINPCENSYEILDDDTCLTKFKEFLKIAHTKGVKLIVDLTANFVPKTHHWFQQSENNKTGEFGEYFTWAVGAGFKEDGTTPNTSTNWVSTYNVSAWEYSPVRKEYYLHQFRSDLADLNFHNDNVVKHFDDVLRKWVEAGVDGVRLLKARQLIVSKPLRDDPISDPRAPTGAAVKQYPFYVHTYSSDRPELDQFFQHWAHLVRGEEGEKVFTIHEDGTLPQEWYKSNNASLLHPPSARARPLGGNVTAFAEELKDVTRVWTDVQISAEDAQSNQELVAVAILLPATPVLSVSQLPEYNNDTKDHEKFSRLADLRDEQSIKYGESFIAALPAHNASDPLLAAARWKKGQPGYLVVFNPHDEEQRANLTAVPRLPAALTVKHVSQTVRLATDYTHNSEISADNVVVPGRSSVVFSYVPNTEVEA